MVSKKVLKENYRPSSQSHSAETKYIDSSKMDSLITEMKNFREHNDPSRIPRNFHRHVCAVISGRPEKSSIRAMGFNHQLGDGGLIHSEVHACQRAFRNTSSSGRKILCDKRRKKFNIVILRFSNSENLLARSDPCWHCVQYMKLYENQINRVYFSSCDDSRIQYCSLSSLIQADTRYYSSGNKSRLSLS
ncbi:MAG: hypothetical protein JKX76_01435 [Colwellia sp.]|nr:hypothetical protein [Colwellia sp.]